MFSIHSLSLIFDLILYLVKRELLNGKMFLFTFDMLTFRFFVNPELTRVVMNLTHPKYGLHCYVKLIRIQFYCVKNVCPILRTIETSFMFQEYDFHVRWPTVKLLTILLTNKCKDVQECILVYPMGVSRLMDLLTDSREIIRNDVRHKRFVHNLILQAMLYYKETK